MQRLRRAPLVLVALSACTPPARFALRPVITHDDDARPFAPAPAVRPFPRVADAVDRIALRPAADALRFDTPHEAHDVNALDEVPDSTWFTNRTPSPGAMTEGACAGVAAAQPPFAVAHVKDDGSTPGLVVNDALGRRFVVKLDDHADTRPETSTAADVISSRLYWAVGYNTPCNRVAYVRAEDFVLAPNAYRTDEIGAHTPVTLDAVRSVLAHAIAGPNGTVRVGTSLWVAGEPLGPWSDEGVRGDDPNDVVPHERRRELRGEFAIDAWVNHWDAREVNTLDTFVASSDGRGHVVHWMIDFGDTLGGRVESLARTRRLGYASPIFPAPWAVHPWEHVHEDPRAPSLGFFESEHFALHAWAPMVPQARFAAASPQDLGWMARKIANVTPAHVRVAIDAGALSVPTVRARLLEVLLARRERILREAFAHSSPLADVAIEGPALCATDLALREGLAAPTATRYAARFATRGTSVPLDALPPAPGARVCVTLPPPRASDALPDDSPARYAVVTLTRASPHGTTELRAHVYDLGVARGYRLAGIER